MTGPDPHGPVPDATPAYVNEPRARRVRRPRPKVFAAGQSTVGAGVLAYLLRLAGVDVDDVPAEVLIIAAGGIATGAAYLRRDGLAGAWSRVVRGERVD